MAEGLDYEQQLSELRRQLEDEGVIHDGDTLGTSDHDLSRFLRAQNFNVQQSKDIIVKCQHWRKTVQGIGIDRMYEATNPHCFPEKDVVLAHWPMYFHKTDKLGRPLNINALGKVNLSALHAEVPPERLLEILTVTQELFTREVLPACSRSAGRLIETGFMILDLNGFSVSQFWQLKDLLGAQFRISQDYYPETMGKLVLVNAPFTFTYAWSAIKLWLPVEIASKVEILGFDYKDTLLEFIDAENLPAIYGGTCLCEGDGGCVMSDAGPWKEEKMAAKAVGGVGNERQNGTNIELEVV